MRDLSGGPARSPDVYQRVLTDLAHSPGSGEPIERTLQRVTEAAARALDVARVNVWFYDRGRTGIRCHDHYDAATNTHRSGDFLAVRDFPSYFAALDELRTIAAMDAEHDPRTVELLDTYLRPHGITTMLDAPLRRDGHTIGVLCHEHVGPHRAWTSSARLFAGSLADLIVLALASEERVRLEQERAILVQQIHTARRLEALGLLAGGIAHDFRNLMQAVTGNAELLESELTPGFQRECLADIQVAARRATEACEHLLAFAGYRRPALEALDVAALVEEVVRLSRVQPPAGVTVTCAVDGTPPGIQGDPTQLRQVVLNLVANARDAAAAGGGNVRVRVAAEDYDGLPRHPEYDWRDGPGCCVVVEVGDDGKGMDEVTRRKMFDPFFSTKKEGMGLGLAAALGTIRAHAGAIEVQSAAGLGTTVRLLLPVAPAD